jgi:hypothetical protein
MPLPFGLLAELVSDVSDLVHDVSAALTTIGCARLHNLWAWDDASLGLDLLQLHSYPDARRPKQDTDVFGMPANTLGVRRRSSSASSRATGRNSIRKTCSRRPPRSSITSSSPCTAVTRAPGRGASAAPTRTDRVPARTAPRVRSPVPRAGQSARDRGVRAMRPSVRQLAWVIARDVNRTVGGGMASMELLRRSFDARKWVDAPTHGLFVAVSRLTPGTTILAYCAAVGWRLQGWPGTLAAVAAASSRRR